MTYPFPSEPGSHFFTLSLGDTKYILGKLPTHVTVQAMSKLYMYSNFGAQQINLFINLIFPWTFRITLAYEE